MQEEMDRLMSIWTQTEGDETIHACSCFRFDLESRFKSGD